MFTDLAEEKLGGHLVVNIYLFLIVSGSFACALAFHNAASRYLYAIGREVPATEDDPRRHPRRARTRRTSRRWCRRSSRWC